MSGVLAVMDRGIELLLEGSSPMWTAQDVKAMRAAVAELTKCCEVTVKAFEALGRTDNVISQLEAHRECERALIEQKRALARVQGGGQS